MAEAGSFPTDLFGCCNVKNCSVESCCKICCCAPCNYGSAMEATELGPCLLCCIAISTPLTLFVGAYNRGRLAEKYNIDESMGMSCAVHICCHPCAMVQDMNLVAVKENRNWGCGSMEYDGAPVAAEAMAR